MWLKVSSYGFFAFLVASLVLLVLPGKWAAKLPRPARALRNRILGIWRRSRELTAEGPFYKLLVWGGKKLGKGYLASVPQAPSVKVKPHGSNEVEVTLNPRLHWNPFHEENYIISWCLAEEEKPVWRSREFNGGHDCEKVGGKLRTVVEGLPDNATLRLRAAAVNKRGQSAWSKAGEAETMARPSDGNGFTGPAGRAAGRKALYSWTQTPTEVHVKIPLGPVPKARDIRFKCPGPRLEVHLSEQAVGGPGKPTELLVGALFQKVRPDEIFWTIEEDDPIIGRHLQIQLVKAEPLQKWECLVEADGHPRVDTKYVRFWTAEDMTGLGGIGDLANLRR